MNAGHAVGVVCDASTGGSLDEAPLERLRPFLSLGLTPLSHAPPDGAVRSRRRLAHRRQGAAPRIPMSCTVMAPRAAPMRGRSAPYCGQLVIA